MLLFQPPVDQGGPVPKEDNEQYDGIHFRGREGKVAYTKSVLDILKRARVW